MSADSHNFKFSRKLRTRYGQQPDLEDRRVTEKELGTDCINHQLSNAGLQHLFQALDAERDDTQR